MSQEAGAPLHETSRHDIRFFTPWPHGRRASFRHNKQLWLAMPSRQFSEFRSYRHRVHVKARKAKYRLQNLIHTNPGLYPQLAPVLILLDELKAIELIEVDTVLGDVKV